MEVEELEDLPANEDNLCRACSGCHQVQVQYLLGRETYSKAGCEVVRHKNTTGPNLIDLRCDEDFSCVEHRSF